MVEQSGVEEIHSKNGKCEPYVTSTTARLFRASSVSSGHPLFHTGKSTAIDYHKGNKRYNKKIEASLLCCSLYTIPFHTLLLLRQNDFFCVSASQKWRNFSRNTPRICIFSFSLRFSSIFVSCRQGCGFMLSPFSSSLHVRLLMAWRSSSLHEVIFVLLSRFDCGIVIICSLLVAWYRLWPDWFSTISRRTIDKNLHSSKMLESLWMVAAHIVAILHKTE